MRELYFGDCFEVIGGLKDKSVDLLVTDPPYRFDSRGGGFYAKGKDANRRYLDNLESIGCCAFNPIEFLNIVKPKLKKFYGYFFCNKALIGEYLRFAKENKYSFDVLVMAKSNPIPAFNNHHLSDLEYIVMIREKGAYFSKHKQIDDFRKFYITSCKKGLHPAEKPVELLERFIRVSSKESDVILDPFMGSGATGIACMNTNRRFIGVEVTEQYFDIASKRLEEYKGISNIDCQPHECGH